MKTTVFVEKVGKKKYRASTTQPIWLESEGASQDRALERLYELAKKRLSGGHPDANESPGGAGKQHMEVIRGYLDRSPRIRRFSWQHR